jgi:hypothetical protein
LPRAFADAAASTHDRHLSSCWLDIRRQMLTVRCVGMTVQVYISMLDSEHQPSEYLYPCWAWHAGLDCGSFIIFKLGTAPSWSWDARISSQSISLKSFFFKTSSMTTFKVERSFQAGSVRRCS